MMFVKPVNGARVLDPAHFRPIPPEGAEVEDSAYWQRHIRRGDLAEAVPEPVPQAEAA